MSAQTGETLDGVEAGNQPGFDRRRFVAVCSAVGLANTLLPGALLALASQSAAAQTADTAKPTATPKVTVEMIEAAAWVAGITQRMSRRP